jgi:hypothetical protein
MTTQKHERKIYPKFRAKVNGGRLYFEDEGLFSKGLFPYEGKEVDVIVKPPVKDRSPHEHKYYFAVPIPMIADAMGTSKEDAHELLTHMFLREFECHKNSEGKTVKYTRTLSITELSDKAFHEYVFEQVLPWAALPTLDTGLSKESGLELYIPSPNEADFSTY